MDEGFNTYMTDRVLASAYGWTESEILRQLRMNIFPAWSLRPFLGIRRSDIAARTGSESPVSTDANSRPTTR